MKSHVFASLRLTPTPSSAQEFRHIYQCLGRLAPIDYFHMARPRASARLVENPLRVVFNVERFGELGPFEPAPVDVEHPKVAQEALVSYLHQICALPRHQYVHNDERYASGEIEVPFKFGLSPAGWKFDKVRVGGSTRSSPFCLVDKQMGPAEYEEFKRSVRFNFEKFTMLQVQSVKTGDRALQEAERRRRNT